MSFGAILSVALMLTFDPVSSEFLNTASSDMNDGGYGGQATSESFDPPIIIDSDAELVAMAIEEGWDGDGSASDPYVISGYHINGTGTWYCIYVGNVTLHLVIRDNHLVNASYGPGQYVWPLESCLAIRGCSNISIVSNLIENCTSTYQPSHTGIFISDSTARVEGNRIENINTGISSHIHSYDDVSKVYIANNTISNFTFNGIDVGGSDARIEHNEIRQVRTYQCHAISAQGGSDLVPNATVVISNNSVMGLCEVGGSNITIADNVLEGIDAMGTDGLLVVKNSLTSYYDGLYETYGLYLVFDNWNLTLRSNTFHGCGIQVYKDAFDALDARGIDQSNTVDGHPILCVVNESDRRISGEWGQVILARCENVTMRDYAGDHPWAGIVCGMTDNLTVENVTLSSPMNATIVIYRGTGFRIANCTFENVSIGGWGAGEIRESSGGMVCDNHLRNGTIALIYVSDSSFIDNEIDFSQSTFWVAFDAWNMSNASIEDNRVRCDAGLARRSNLVGIRVCADSMTKVRGNVVFDGGFYIWGGAQQRRNIDWGAGNTLDGMPVIYRKDTVGEVFTDDYGQVILVGCRDFIIDRQDFPRSTVPVQLWGCENGRIQNSTFLDLLSAAVETEACKGIEVRDCVMDGGSRAIFSQEDDRLEIISCTISNTSGSSIDLIRDGNVSLEGNIILNSDDHGVYMVYTVGFGCSFTGNYIANCARYALDVENSKVWNNTFIDNALRWYAGGPPHLQCSGSGRMSWDDGTRGNYWSDYSKFYPTATNDGQTWSEPFNPNKGLNPDDHHPLVHPWDPFAPEAVAGPDLTVYEGEPFQLNASLSRDNIGIVRYTWSYSIGETNVVLEGAVVDRVVRVPGTYNVSLRVEDAAGHADTAVIVLTVLPNHPPVAEAGEDQVVPQGTCVVLNGTASSDDGGIARFNWSLTYDGRPVLLQGPVVEYIFGTVGEYVVVLIVTDMGGKWAQDGVRITVLDAEPPVINVGRTLNATLGEPVWFDARTSTDNVAVAGWTWTFTYAGAEQTLAGPHPSFIFQRPGTYEVLLRLTDAAGNENMTIVTVGVLDVNAPVFTHPEWLMVSVTTEDLVLRYNWTLWADDDASFPEGAEFAWEFERGGVSIVKEGAFVEAALPKQGLYNATFTAYDASGNRAFHSFLLDVKWRPTHVRWPGVDAGEDIAVELGGRAELHASVVPGELALEGVRWTVPTVPATSFDGADLNLTPDRVGVWELVIRVWDWMGNTVEDRVNVTVLPRTPVIEVTRMPGGVPVSGQVEFEGTASGDVPIERVEYRVDDGDWMAADGTGSWSFVLDSGKLGDGNHTVTVRAWDGHSHGLVGPMPFQVENPTGDGHGGGGTLLYIGLVLLVAVAAIVLILLSARRRGRSKPQS